MRIAQVAPLFESVPPRLYGGTERVVSYLTEELVAAGHDVTLFASGDSVTNARLVSPVGEALRLAPTPSDPVALHVLMLEQVLRDADQFDLIHCHWEYLHFPAIGRSGRPNLTTMHLRLDRPEWATVARAFPRMPLVSVSFAQRAQLPEANWMGTVYHGIPASRFTPRSEPGRYLAFVGRISPEKRVDRAIEIARRVGMPLRIAAKVAEGEVDYFESAIRPLIDGRSVEFVGEIGEREKDEFLGNAYALLFPIDWPEPFGLVQIEAMACGTPVIAFRHGAVPEVVRDGVTGFVVDDVEGAVRAVRRVSLLDRAEVRLAFEASFTARRMAGDYLALYEQLVEREPIGRPRRWSVPRVVGSLAADEPASAAGVPAGS